MDRISKGEWVVVFAGTLLALIVRLVALNFKEPITGDGVWYATLGKNLASGNFRAGFSTYWSPLYPVLVGIPSLVFGDAELGGRLVSLVAGCLLIIPVYLLARELYGRDAARLAAFITIIFPAFISFSTAVLTEATYTLLFATGIYVGLKALTKGSNNRFFLAGILFGGCYLVKPEAIGYVGLLIALTISTKVISRELSAKRVTLNALTLLLGVSLLALPYLLYLHHQTGGWTISEKLVATSTAFPGWRKLTDGGETTYADKIWVGTAQANSQSVINPTPPTIIPPANRQNPARPQPGLFQALGRRLLGIAFMYEVLRKVIQPLLILLVGLGLFATRWDRGRAGREIYLASFLMATVVGYGFIRMPEQRYLVPLFPIIICWSAKGMIELVRWLAESLEGLGPGVLSEGKRMLLKPLVVAVVVISLLPAIVSPFMSKPWNPRPIASWIKEHSKAAPLIMASHPWPAFYSEGQHLYIPDEEYSTVIEYARRKQVDLIVVEEDQIGVTPKLRFLLDEERPHPGLTLLYKSDAQPAHKVFIWGLTGTHTSETATLDEDAPKWKQ